MLAKVDTGWDEDVLWAYDRARAQNRERPGMTWFALFTNPRCERRAEQRIIDEGLCAYLPEGKVWSKPRYATSYIGRLRPAMSRYLFVGDPSRREPDWFALRRVDGVHGIVGVSGLPIAIQGQAIDALRRAENAGRFNFGSKPMEKGKHTPGIYQPGQRVTIASGPYAGFSCPVVRPSTKINVEIELMVFGRAALMSVPLDNVRAAAA